MVSSDMIHVDNVLVSSVTIATVGTCTQHQVGSKSIP